MSKQIYIYCDQCRHCIRVDDGTYCQHYITKARSHNSESVTVVYRAKSGKICAPFGNPDDPKVIAYAKKMGYQREEYRGAQSVRRLEKEMDAKDLRKHQQHQLKMENIFGRQRQQRREDLQQIIREGQTTTKNPDGSTRVIRVSEMGRDIAREALRRSESGYSDSNWEAGNQRS